MLVDERKNRQYPSFLPNRREQEIIRRVYQDFYAMRQVRDKKYRLLGDRTPQQYWNEQEKRFVSFSPPKDMTEDDWQSNIIMGITRNAVLSQVSKSGMKVPEARVQSYNSDGFLDNERSRMFQNFYKWSLRREGADRMQQYISLGNYVRGNACVYEGFEDKEIELEIVVDIDDDGEPTTEKQKMKRWGPRRQMVPLHELHWPIMFANDIQDQPVIIWRQVLQYNVAKSEFGDRSRWRFVVPGAYKVGDQSDAYFYSNDSLEKDQVEVLRVYGNPWKGGKDRYRVLANGIPLIDMPLPFNHKRLPFAWCRNNPFSDKFMLGMGIPFQVMDSQDTADSIWNMALDKNLLSLQKPLMTDDPDPNIRTYLSPNSIMQFKQGSKWEMAPFEGVSSGEFTMLQESMRQAKEFTGAYGGGNAQTARGGQVTARQAVMAEEETKRLLGISMANLEFLERDVCVQRLSNLQQFAAASDQRIDVPDVELEDGKKGRFIAIFTKDIKEAMALEHEQNKLSQLEIAGQVVGQPTEAVAIAPKWLDDTDRLDAEVVPESSYLSSKSIEEAIAAEDYTLFQPNPLVDQQELLRLTMKKKGMDPEKLISKAAPAPVPGAQPEGAPMPVGAAPNGSVTTQLAGSNSLGALAPPQQ